MVHEGVMKGSGMNNGTFFGWPPYSRLRASESFTRSHISHAKLRRRYFAATRSSRGPRIPTRFRPKAQGCEEQATLGHRQSNILNRNAVVANPFLTARMTSAATPLALTP